jgi:hypothetical protein
MRRSGRAEVQLRVFLTSAQAAHEWSASRSGHVTHRGNPPTPIRPQTGMRPKVGLDAVEKNVYTYPKSNRDSSVVHTTA